MRYPYAAFVTCLASVCAVFPARAADADEKPDPKVLAYFETSVRPVLAANCYKCHSGKSGDKPKGGLVLDSREGMLKGGKRGPAVVPGNPRQSLLIKAVMRGDDKLAMPPKKALDEEQVRAIGRWIKQGAPWPAELATQTGAAAPAATDAKYGEVSAKYEQIRREHWSFQPVRDVRAPQVSNPAWAKSDVDRFILSALDEKELKPSQPADRRTLLRRATFDLTGLPPTPEETEAFVADNSPKAFEKVVDRLLASPAFGERWGRHWLDVARYAESTGMTRNTPYYYAWRYRDYVIDSFNADKPFDRFIKEQVAGDLLPAKTDQQRDEQLIATGFLALGTKDLNVRNPLQFSLNNADEQIDTTTRAFMGLTVACARCHDHKFDPIPTAEYYAMAGIFRSTELLAGVTSRKGPREYYDADLLLPLSGAAKPAPAAKKRPLDTTASVMPIADFGERDDDAGERQARGGKAGEQARQLLQRRQQANRRQMRQQALAGGERDVRPVAIGVRDGRLPTDSNVFIRGEFTDRGPVVPRGTVTLPGMSPLGPVPSDQSGRLQLAEWIASPQNPLTARVTVNRVWQHLFGRGLVDTVDNFGTTGEAPTHPELLDHLATQFVKDGWSVKRTIKRLMLTSTYQQAGTFDEAKFTADPDNRLLWRATPRRLEGEAIRDAMLAAAGTLDRDRPVGSGVMRLAPLQLNRVALFADRLSSSADNNARSVYLTLVRGAAPAALDVFDLADNSQVTGSRDVTTVAPQALFMMNDAFVLAQAKALAQRVTTERNADAARIDRAYSLTLGRIPTDAERARALKYVRAFASDVKDHKDAKPGKNEKVRASAGDIAGWSSFCQALLASAEFRYVN